ncbi:nucleotidyltransferase family protein [Halomonas elongata]|uniref:nucleotidyltransferase family protein n=1 Tax=Halomonas elongata TaxID=2746 RepID=UPI003364CD21
MDREPAMFHDPENRILAWLHADPVRCEALELAERLGLADWCLAAGFVRNLVWDRLHGYAHSTPLNDIDLVYFDPDDDSESRDRDLEGYLNSVSRLPWSVKNQARMHERNGDAPYRSTSDAMTYWVERETAVGVRLDGEGSMSLVAPLGLTSLLEGQVTYNPRCRNMAAFRERSRNKDWLSIWPRLVVAG